MSSMHKFTNKIELTKVPSTTNDPNNYSFLDVDVNGRLVISSRAADTGGILVQGATSTSTFEGSVVVDGNLTLTTGEIDADLSYDPTYVNSLSSFVGTITETNIKDLADRLVLGSWGAKVLSVSGSDLTLTADQAKCAVSLISGSPTTRYRAKVISIVSGGTGYTIGDVLTIVGGTSSVPLTVTVDGEAAGVINSVILDTSETESAGIYTVVPPNSVSVTGTGGNDDATFDIIWEEHYSSLIYGLTDVIPGFGFILNSTTKPIKIGRSNTNYVNRGTLYPTNLYNILDFGFGIFPFQTFCNSSVGSNNINLWTDDDIDVGNESNHFKLFFEDPNSILTTDRIVNFVPANPFFVSGLQIVTNNTLQNITYKANGNTGVAVRPSQSEVVYNDGNDIVRVPLYLDYLSDVSLTSDSEGDVLIRKEGSWINSSHTKLYETQTTTSTDGDNVVLFEGESISIPSGKVASFQVFVTGVRTGGVAGGGSVGDAAYARIHGGIKNISGTTSIIGTNESDSEFEDVTWSISVVANNTTDTLDVVVNGDTDKDITWTVTVHLHIS